LDSRRSAFLQPLRRAEPRQARRRQLLPKLYYHQLGKPQSEDVLVYERADQKEGLQWGVTEDGKYLVISVWLGTDPRNLVFYKDLTDPAAQVVELIREFEASYSFIDNGAVFCSKLMPPVVASLLLITNPARDQWQEIILRQMKHSKVLV